MRHRTRDLILALLSIAILNILATASASAISFWQVEGQELAAGSTKALTILRSENYLLKATGTEVKCTGQTAKGAELIGGEESTGEGTLEFLGCTAAKPCSVPATITAPVKTELVENTSKSTVYDLVLAKSGSTLTTIKFEGEECALAGTQPLKGTVVGELSQSEEATQQSLHFPTIAIKEVVDGGEHTKSISLALGSSSATLSGKSSLELKSQQRQMPLISYVRVVHPAEYVANNETKNVKIKARRAVTVNGLVIDPFLPANVIAFMIKANLCEKAYAANQECEVPVEFTGPNANVKYTNIFGVHPMPYPANVYQSTIVDGEY